MGRVVGPLIHNSFGGIKRAADFGRNRLTWVDFSEVDRKWSWLGSGDKQSPRLFDFTAPSALSNVRPISEKSAYVGRLLRSRPEWSWPRSGDKQSPWLFDSLLLRHCQTRGRFRRNRPTWVDFSEVAGVVMAEEWCESRVRGCLIHCSFGMSNAWPDFGKSAYVGRLLRSRRSGHGWGVVISRVGG